MGIYKYRRHYQVGRILLVQHSENVFVVGKVKDMKENNDVVLFVKENNTNSYKQSEDELTYPVQKC